MCFLTLTWSESTNYSRIRNTCNCISILIGINSKSYDFPSINFCCLILLSVLFYISLSDVCTYKADGMCCWCSCGGSTLMQWITTIYKHFSVFMFRLFFSTWKLLRLNCEQNRFDCLQFASTIIKLIEKLSGYISIASCKQILGVLVYGSFTSKQRCGEISEVVNLNYNTTTRECEGSGRTK